MPMVSPFQTIFRSRYIENYASLMLRENFDFKKQWLSYTTLVERNLERKKVEKKIR